MEFFEKLKECRIENSLTQKEVAKKAGLSITGYAGYEQGYREPDLKTISKIADVLGCSVDYLLGREDDFGKIIGGENGVILNADEEELVKAYRKLSSSTKSAMLSTLKSLSEKENK